MPIYMDRHYTADTVNSEAVSSAHEQDLDHQHKFGCKALSVWFDVERSAVFCLFDAPSKKAVIDLHKEAHGQIPHQIIEVDLAIVESFLGKVKDPESHEELTRSVIRSVIFTDLKDSTSFNQKYGDDRSMEMLRSYSNIIRDISLKYQGRIIKNTGDGFMISFVSAAGAVECAIAFQKELDRFNTQNPEFPLEVRIGINAGEPVAEGEDLFGSTIQLASRICDRALSGEILTSSVMYELCLGKNLPFIKQESVSLKGFDQLIDIYKVEWINYPKP